MNKAKKTGYQALGAIKVIGFLVVLTAGAMLGWGAKENEVRKLEEAKNNKAKFTGYNRTKF